MVDDADFDWLNQWKWHASKRKRKGREVFYACRVDGQCIYMHRQIMGSPPGLQVDHRDGEGLNNQRYNLRRSTHAQNLSNSRKRAGCSSRFKGVYSRRSGKWLAQIRFGGRSRHLGIFEKEEEAARAYNKAAATAFGEFARLN